MTPDTLVSPDKSSKDYSWISQHDLPDPLNKFSRHFCGVACAAMVTRQSIPEVLRKVAKITVVPNIDQGKPVPENSWINVPHPDGDIPILVGPTVWMERYPEANGFNASPAQLSKNSHRITPFNLRGWMHDSSEDFFKEYGLSAKKIEETTDLSPLIADGQVIMASVKNNVWMTPESKGTHVVLITDQNENAYKVYDPNAKKPGPIWMDKDKFHSAFNGYGTAVKIK